MLRYLLVVGIVTVLSIPAHAQSIVVSLQISSGDGVSETLHFGVHDDATITVDPYDVPLPPPEPAEPLSAAFLMSGYTGPLDNRWRDEFRETLLMEDESEDWTLVVDSDQVGGTIHLHCAALVGADLPLGVVISPTESRPKRDSLPADIDLPVTSLHMTWTVTLIWDDPTANEDAEWGEVKALYYRD